MDVGKGGGVVVVVVSAALLVVILLLVWWGLWVLPPSSLYPFKKFTKFFKMILKTGKLCDCSCSMVWPMRKYSQAEPTWLSTRFICSSLRKIPSSLFVTESMLIISLSLDCRILEFLLGAEFVFVVALKLVS